MRYAVISDIHGNISAFEAVLEDAGRQKVNGFILLGDYGGLGNTNAIVRILKTMVEDRQEKERKDLLMISGNGEEYIRKYADAAESGHFPLQLAPILYECNHITMEHKAFLLNLPKELKIEVSGSKLCMAHSPNDLFGGGTTEFFGGRSYINLMREDKLRDCTYNGYIQHSLEQDADFLHKLEERDEDVFLFGHYHTQWHAKVRGKILINPGACGMPCDFQTTAPYTILENTENGWVIEERRVNYNRTHAIEAFRHTKAFDSMNIWSDLYIAILKTGINAPPLFLEHAYALMQKKGISQAVCPDEIWLEAMDSWKWD